MASIWKNPKSRYWTACFRDSHGRQKRLSTKTTDRRIAQRIADEYEKAIRNRRTFSQLQKVLSRYHEELCGEAVQQQSLRAFCQEWLKAKNPSVAPATLRFYRTTITKLFDYFGTRCDESIATITRSDLVGFRNRIASTVSPRTLNHDLLVVRMLFREAKRDNHIADNPAEFLDPVRQNTENAFQRRAFTLPELSALLSVADPEWQSMIRIGLYSGARLGDIAILRWSNIDLPRSELRYVAKKTGKSALIPIVGALQTHLTSLSSTDNPHKYLHPRAAAYLERTGRSGQLSHQFGELLVQAGLRVERPRNHQKVKGPRILDPLSFHSLRHTAVSMLKDAGIPMATVMEMVGHSSAQMSQLYTHVGREALERASAALPSI